MNLGVFYEFESVVDKETNQSKINNDMYKKPVQIYFLKLGAGCILTVNNYTSINTTKVESMHIIYSHIHIETMNTEYILKPVIRELG